MAIHRGIQSALFYYLSCAPCAEARGRKRRKQEAKLSYNEHKALGEGDTSQVYRHPGAPSSTNPYWQSEIELGPTFVRKGKKKAITGDSQRGLQAERISSNTSNEQSLVDVRNRSGSDSRTDGKWNFRLDQRDDEELWGGASMLDGSMYSSSIRRPPTARTTGSSSSMYHSTRNPAINDMHPPTVTKVSRREDVMWMMQPLPVAEVMSGKERAVRSGSNSGTSRLSPSSTTMSRQVSNRIIERKLRAGTPLAVGISRGSSCRSANESSGPRHDVASDHDFAISPARERPPPSPSQQSKEQSDESAETILRKPELAAAVRHPPRRAASRPQLSTVLSESDMPAQLRCAAPKENNLPSPHPSTNGTPDLHGGLVRRSTIAPDHKPSGTAARHKHEDSELSIRPELFDSWYTPEFELPKWIAEHTKREVRERWSMDI